MSGLYRAGLILFAVVLFPGLTSSPSGLAAQEPDQPSIFGFVTGQDGEPLSAAQIELLNRESEVRTLRITTAEGRFEFPDLDPGTPYLLIVRSAGFTTEERDDIVLNPGEARRIDIVMATPVFQLEQIDVTVDRRFDAALSGPVISMTREEVIAHPSTERHFMELAKLSPIAVQTSDGGEMSISGQNERHNSILIDGSLNQDVFGASPSGVPGAAARAKPMPIDAIEHFRIEAAPFDVGVSGFTGGVMNALTRRGTNEWSGSAFSEFRNERFFGSLELQGADVAPEEFTKHVWGFDLGGPIREDLAHFFVALEFEDRNEPSMGFIRGVHDPIATGVLPDSLDAMAGILQNQYGMDVGSSGQVSLRNPLRNVFTRLDWQISEANSLVLRHNFSGAARDSTPNRSPVRPYEFSSAGYRAESASHAVTAQLTTELGGGHANQFTANVQHISEQMLPNSTDPMVDVLLRGVDEDVVLRRNARAGSRYFSQQNALDQSILQLSNRLFLDRGPLQTTLGIGLDYFSFDYDDRPGFRGYYQFDGLASLAMNRPHRYEILMTDPDRGDPTVELSVVQPHLYFQNHHEFPDGFVLSYGMRMDVPIFRGEPEWNEAIDQEFDLRTDVLPSVNLTFSPRLGFNWQPATRRRTQLRGTFGVFTANLPYVWMADAIRHNGLSRTVMACTDTAAPDLDPSAPPPTACRFGAGDQQARVVVFREDFRLPRELKVTMALDQELPGSILMTAEALFIPTFSRTAVRDLNLPAAGSAGDQNYARAFGDRAHYGDALIDGYAARRRFEGFSQVLQIENEKRAALAWSTTLQLERRFTEWLLMTGSVSASRTNDEQSMSFGDMATNLAATPVGRIANQFTARPANFDRPWKYLLSARMNVPERWGGSRVALIYVGQSGQPYSYTYASDINGDGFPGPGIPLDGSNSLLWVPETPSSIPGSLITKSLFAQFAGQVEECLSDVRGAIMQRNSCRTPMTHMVDLSFMQPIEFGGIGFEVNADLLNVLNLFNSDWGRVWEVDPVVPILDFAERLESGADPDGPRLPSDPPTLVYTGARERDPETGSLRPVLPHTLIVPASQWQAQVGMRIRF